MTDFSKHIPDWLRETELVLRQSNMQELLKLLNIPTPPTPPSLSGVFLSKLFEGNTRLEQCAKSHQSHVTIGNQGAHVKLIHTALQTATPCLFPNEVAMAVWLLTKSLRHRPLLQEYSNSIYGPETAAIVLQYKKIHKIINSTYQTVPDNIVGIMTIKHLDSAVWAAETANLKPPTISPDGKFRPYPGGLQI